MKNYQITYSGNNPRFRNLSEIVTAESEREAVISWYKSAMDYNYFPQDDGSILDCDGYEISTLAVDTIEFDGGWFSATECTYDVHFDDDTKSDSKGFHASLDWAIDFVKNNNGTNNSYFTDYKGGTVSIICNETGETVYEEEVR